MHHHVKRLFKGSKLRHFSTGKSKILQVGACKYHSSLKRGQLTLEPALAHMLLYTCIFTPMQVGNKNISSFKVRSSGI